METIIKTSGGERIKRLALGLLCFGVALILWARSPILGILALIGGVSLWMPGALKLDETGFSYKTLVGFKRVEWASVDSFCIVTRRWMGIIVVSRKVGWRFAKQHERSLVARAAGALVSYDGVLPENYGMKSAELVALLEAQRRQATSLMPQEWPKAW